MNKEKIKRIISKLFTSGTIDAVSPPEPTLEQLQSYYTKIEEKAYKLSEIVEADKKLIESCFKDSSIDKRELHFYVEHQIAENIKNYLCELNCLNEIEKRIKSKGGIANKMFTMSKVEPMSHIDELRLIEKFYDTMVSTQRNYRLYERNMKIQTELRNYEHSNANNILDNHSRRGNANDYREFVQAYKNKLIIEGKVEECMRKGTLHSPIFVMTSDCVEQELNLSGHCGRRAVILIIPKGIQVKWADNHIQYGHCTVLDYNTMTNLNELRSCLYDV